MCEWFFAKNIPPYPIDRRVRVRSLYAPKQNNLGARPRREKLFGKCNAVHRGQADSRTFPMSKSVPARIGKTNSHWRLTEKLGSGIDFVSEAKNLKLNRFVTEM